MKFFEGEIPPYLDIEGDKISEGNAPPNCDPGVGLPERFNLSVKCRKVVIIHLQYQGLMEWLSKGEIPPYPDIEDDKTPIIGN